MHETGMHWGRSAVHLGAVWITRMDEQCPTHHPPNPPKTTICYSAVGASTNVCLLCHGSLPLGEYFEILLDSLTIRPWRDHGSDRNASGMILWLICSCRSIFLGTSNSGSIYFVLKHQTTTSFSSLNYAPVNVNPHAPPWPS